MRNIASRIIDKANAFERANCLNAPKIFGDARVWCASLYVTGGQVYVYLGVVFVR